jgi:hypothetical protein
MEGKIRTSRRFPRTVYLEDELDLDIQDPNRIADKIKADKNIKADIFTFIQRIPFSTPLHGYHHEFESIAALEYKNYDYWFNKIIDSKCRNTIRKAEKKGVAVRIANFNHEFVQGIVNIYNESPVRQGRRFLHYRKSFNEVREANASHLERSDFIGAYYGTELIGFIKLVYGDRSARTEQIISQLQHRDKAPTNALLSKAVELCDAKMVPYLIYGVWSEGSLGEFKKNNGFKKYSFPRYFVPLNARGRIALRLGLHKGLKHHIPDILEKRLISLRTYWYKIISGP